MQSVGSPGFYESGLTRGPSKSQWSAHATTSVINLVVVLTLVVFVIVLLNVTNHVKERVHRIDTMVHKFEDSFAELQNDIVAVEANIMTAIKPPVPAISAAQYNSGSGIALSSGSSARGASSGRERTSERAVRFEEERGTIFEGAKFNNAGHQSGRFNSVANLFM